MRIRRALLWIACVAALACARHVVREPEAAARLNDPDWTVRSEPGPKAQRPAPVAP
jgi:hypothetical protein